MGNIWKTGILMAVLMVFMVLIGKLIGGNQGAIFAFGIMFVINFVSYWFSDKIVLAMYGGKEVTEREASELYNIVRGLSQRMALPMPKVYIIPTPSANAFATGRDYKHSAVAVTQGNLDILNRDELEAVMAHEMTHIKNRDTLISTIVAAMAGAITLLARIAGFSAMFGGSRDDNRGGGGLAILIYIFAPLAALFIQLAISRSREFSADEGGARVTGHPMSLASALNKLVAASKQTPLQAEPATAHMFVVSPLSGGGFFEMFSTHPPIKKRIMELEKLEKKIRTGK